MPHERQLLTFIVPYRDKDMFVDYLISNTAISGFTVVDSQGFSREHSQYDVGEQIAGHRRVARFEVLASTESLKAALPELQTLASDPFVYWQLPSV